MMNILARWMIRWMAERNWEMSIKILKCQERMVEYERELAKAQDAERLIKRAIEQAGRHVADAGYELDAGKGSNRGGWHRDSY